MTDNDPTESLYEVVTDTPLVDLPVLVLAGVIWLLSTLAGPLICVALFQGAYSAACTIKRWVTR